MSELSKEQFVEHADLLGDRQAEAFWLRHIKGISRGEAATRMNSSKSNVDNLERAAHAKILKASNLVSVVDAAGADIQRAIGVCSRCCTPTSELRPDPTDDRELESTRMLCAECHGAVN